MATSTVATPPEVEPAKVDQAIHSMEKLYRAVTGQDPPAGAAARSPIPVEKDPAQFVHEQLDRLLSLLEQPEWTSAASSSGPTWAPLLSLYDEEKDWIVQVELPGVERRDVEVTLEDNALTVRGQRAVSRAGAQRLSERPVGPFLRRLLLPPRQQLGEPKARLRDGVLEVRIEKLAAGKGAPLAITID